MADEVQKKAAGSSHATKLVNLMSKVGAELFHSPEGDPYVTVVVNDHRETLSLGGRAFRQYLAREYYLATKRGRVCQVVEKFRRVIIRRDDVTTLPFSPPSDLDSHQALAT